MKQTLKQREALAGRKRKGAVRVKEFPAPDHLKPKRIDGAPQPDGPHFDPLDDELSQVVAGDEIPSLPIWGHYVFWGLCAISAGFSLWGLRIIGEFLARAFWL